MRWIVIVKPAGYDDIAIYGPFSKITAESIMSDIDGAASDGPLMLDYVTVAPIAEGLRNINLIIKQIADIQQGTIGLPAPGE